MAQATNYFPSQNVEVWYQKETNVGTQPDDAGLTKLQTTSFSIPEASVPVEYSAQRAGHFTTTASQGHHSQGTKMWTFDTTLRGTPKSVLLATEAVFESASSEATLNNDYTFPSATYVTAAGSADTFEFRWINGGSDATLHKVENLDALLVGHQHFLLYIVPMIFQVLLMMREHLKTSEV